VAHFTNTIRRFFSNDSVLRWLIVINVVLFAVVGLTSAAMKWTGIGFSLQSYLSLPSDIIAFLHHPWTLVTYMITQYNLLHLLFNMLCLYWFGQVLLLTLSERHLLWLYIVGGLVGGLLYLAVYNLVPTFSHNYAMLCGSSASVLAVMTAAAFRSPDYRLNLLLIGPVRLRWIAIITIVLAVIGTGGGNAGGEVAHIGGVIAGAWFGLMLRRGRDVTKIFSRMSERRKAKKEQRRIKVDKVASAMQSRRDDMSRLDELLDKIKQSGYKSLTHKERAELDALSKRLQ
jgi:membrane associated rhomboid family serine protease